MESSFSNLSVTSPTSELILEPFRRFTYVTAHFPTLLPLLLRHRLFTYVTWRTAHGDMDSNDVGKVMEGLRMSCDIGEMTERLENELSNPSVALPTSQLILQLFLALPMSQLILQPFFHFSYITGSSLMSPGEPPMEIWIVMMKVKLVVTPPWNKPPLSLFLHACSVCLHLYLFFL